MPWQGGNTFYCAVGVTENCRGLPRVVTDFSSLEILKTTTLTFLGTEWRWPCVRDKKPDRFEQWQAMTGWEILVLTAPLFLRN